MGIERACEDAGAESYWRPDRVLGLFRLSLLSSQVLIAVFLLGFTLGFVETCFGFSSKLGDISNPFLRKRNPEGSGVFLP